MSIKDWFMTEREKRGVSRDESEKEVEKRRTTVCRTAQENADVYDNYAPVKR